MARRFTMNTRVYAIGCAGALALLLAPPTVASPTAQRSAAAAAPSTGFGAGVLLLADADNEVVLSPRSQLPLYGPRYAEVTIDLFLPFGHKATAQDLALALSLAHENPDVRLILHPVLGSEVAERGAEVVFTAWQQSRSLAPAPSGALLAATAADRCFALAAELAQHPEWLAATPEAELLLKGAAQAAALDTGPLFLALRQHSERAQLIDISQRERADVRSPPEVWLNGHRLRGPLPLSETPLREELGRQRGRAYKALRSGTPLTLLYEFLLGKERSELAAAAPWLSRLSSPSSFGGGTSGSAAFSAVVASMMTGSLQPAALSPSPLTTSTRLDLSGSPARGPQVAPVTVVLIGSLDSYGTYVMARVVHEVWSRHTETVRLIFQHAPTSETGRQIALLLTELAQTDPEAFWRAFDGILELMKQRYLLGYRDILNLLSRQHADVGKLEAALKDPAQSTAARDLLSRDLKQAQRLSSPYYPVLFVNGRLQPGQPQADQLEHRIVTELQHGFLSRWLPPHS
jgi:protein-disulfide isomerase